MIVYNISVKNIPRWVKRVYTSPLSGLKGSIEGSKLTKAQLVSHNCALTSSSLAAGSGSSTLQSLKIQKKIHSDVRTVLYILYY